MLPSGPVGVPGSGQAGDPAALQAAGHPHHHWPRGGGHLGYTQPSPGSSGGHLGYTQPRPCSGVGHLGYTQPRTRY